MLPFSLGKIWFSANCPFSLDTEKSCCKKFSQVQFMSQGKQDMRRGKVFALAQGAGERKRKSIGCRVVWPMVKTWVSSFFCAVPCGYALVELCYVDSLCSFSHPPLFREAIRGAITPKAETTSTLSTLCPLHIRFVILQQGQDISSDRCLRVLAVLTRSNLSMGFYFTG